MMEDQVGNSIACMALISVHYSVTAALKDTEWFWGVVLISLLKIGCVESNPGPRSNEVILKAKRVTLLPVSAKTA
jgi:hypothetical protein